MFMKRISSIALAYAVAALLATGGLMAQSPVGVWKTIDDETGEPKSFVQIFEWQGKVGGKITKLINPSEPNPKCTACDGSRKDQPIEGMVIIWGMSQDGDGYSGGQILNPKDGKIYTCKMKVEGNTLKVRGYIGPFFKTQTWHRVN